MNDTSRDAQDSGAFDDEVVVIGSGFGGSVAALRLVEKGYRVRVYEAGRRFEDEDFPKTNWNVRRYLWAPKLGCFGIQRIHRLPHVMILAGAGWAGAPSTTPTRCISPAARSSMTRNGVLSRIGRPTSRRTM